MHRRGFLKVALLGSTGLVIAGSGLALWPSERRHKPRRPLRVIAFDRFCVLCAVAARVVTQKGADPVEIAHRVDEILPLVSPEAAQEINQLLQLLENGLAGFLLDGRLRPFTRLAAADQDAALGAFRESRLLPRRSGYNALRKLCAAMHYAQESTWASVGYPGPPAIAEAIVPAQPALPVAAAAGDHK